MESYFTHCSSLIHSILSCLSLSLSLPSSGLNLPHSESLFQVRLLHYPAISRTGNRGRIHAHSDFCTLTLLFQDNVGGLEIQDPQHPGTFRAAEPIDGTVLVNIGDLLARWSNDRWRSSIHRVGLPLGTKEVGEEQADMVPDRYSIPVFATANMDTVIEALPGCWSEENPKKYETVTAWGYMQERMAALYEWE
jgi:isopenicillin N synthase-like dioxygenase